MLARASSSTVCRRPAFTAAAALRRVATRASAQQQQQQQQQQQPSSPAAPAAFAFESLVAPPAPTATVALRLQRYFASQELNATSPVVRQQVMHSTAFVDKLRPLLQWGFRALSVDKPSSSSNDSKEPHERSTRDAVRDVFVLLTPWTNAARDKAWRSFFMRQFFLSGAPLSTFLDVLELHAAVAPSTPGSAYAKEKDAAFLAADLVQEYCARGRFTEAAAAYAQLPLSDVARRDAVNVVLNHEQFASVVHLYRVHEALECEPPVAPLDPFPLLLSLHKLKRLEELTREFQKLSPQDRNRADIQALMG